MQTAIFAKQENLQVKVYFAQTFGNTSNMTQSILQQLLQHYNNCDDVKIRTVCCGQQFSVVLLETMCNDQKVCDFVLHPLLMQQNAKTLQDVEQQLALSVGTKTPCNFFEVLSDFSNGYTLVFDQEGNGCVAVDTRIALGRAVIEPPTSMVMRGPREGFVEDAKSNVTLLRKRLKTPNFKVVNLCVGKFTNTLVSVCYLENVADKSVVDKVILQVQSVCIDGLLDSSYLARYLDGNKTLLFRRVGSTEKPDVAVGKMLEGRVAIVVDGSPMVLTVPYLYIEDLQSPGDYYENSSMTTINRIFRFVSVLMSVLLPSLYVCLQMYNYQIIPFKFLVTILNATNTIPFSPFTEMLLVLVIFDILREANLRMPSAVGISLSLVGAIVLGDAAVKAGLIGAPAVMIGALSGIGLFTMPDNTLVLSLLRLAITFVGGIAGIVGVLVCTTVITLYLASLQNYKTPFLAPFTPDIPQDRQDGVAKTATEKMKARPRSIPNTNKTRRG